jgi:uncharacterized damage-inducible protein DinB
VNVSSRELVEQYANGAEKLALAIRGLTREDLLAVPDAGAGVGKWSIQQVLIHLADSDTVYADRMKWVISEDNPPLPGFDQEKWAAALHYNEQPADDAMKLIELTRRQMSTILRALPETTFNRTGEHNERGRITLRDLVRYMVEHLDHHVKFIHAKRAKMGKEMW